MFLLALSLGGECKQWDRSLIHFKVDSSFVGQYFVSVQGLNSLHTVDAANNAAIFFQVKVPTTPLVVKLMDQSMPFPFVVKLMDQSMARSK